MFRPLRAPLIAQRGFTLIELLIAVLIIGILASIALPAFNKQRERAKDSAAQQSLEAGLRAAKAVYAEGESFPASGLGALLGRAERSQTFAEATAFPVTAGTINVDRPLPGRVVLRAISASGNQHMLSLDEPDSRVTRWGPQADSASGTLADYTNLSRNPSFETGTSTWSPQANNCALTQSARQTSWAFSGSYSYRLACGPLTANGYVWAFSSGGVGGIPVTPNTRYLLRAQVYNYSVGSPGQGQSIRIYWYDAGGGGAANNTLASVTSQRTGEHTFLAHVTSPSDAAFARLGVYMGGATGDTLDFAFDSVMLTPTDKRLGYFDGDSPGASWSSTAHGSASTGPAPNGSPGW